MYLNYFMNRHYEILDLLGCAVVFKNRFMVVTEALNVADLNIIFAYWRFYYIIIYLCKGYFPYDVIGI